jgi:hypothetical protein
VDTIKLRVGVNPDGAVRVMAEDGRELHGVTKVETILAPGDVVKTVITLVGVAHDLPPKIMTTRARAPMVEPVHGVLQAPPRG